MESSSITGNSLQLECYCGRTFLQTNAYSNHQKTCKKTKARLSSALFDARDNWQRLKRARTVVDPLQPGQTNGSPPVQLSPTSAHPALLLSNDPTESRKTENLSASMDPPESIQALNTNFDTPPVEVQDVSINEVCLFYATHSTVNKIMSASG